MQENSGAKWIITSVILFVVLITAIIVRPFASIKSTDRGIVYKRWAVDRILGEGLHFVTPFAESVKNVPITPTTIDIEIPVGGQGSITKDNQTIWANITIFYKFPQDKLMVIAKEYGFDVLKGKVEKDAIEAFKQTIGQYTIFDVAQKQEEIRVLVAKSLIGKIGAYPIIIDDLKVSNYDRSEEFDKQIGLTMQIAQETKQQEQQLKKVEVEAQQAVKRAEANRQAEALNAEAMKLKGEWVKAYNDSITADPKNMELEIKLKELENERLRIEKWNGAYVPDNNYLPIPFNYGTSQGN